MTIRIITSGAIGFEELLSKSAPGYQVHTLDTLAAAAAQKHWPEFYDNSLPFLISVKPEFTRDDLKATTDDSEQLQGYLRLLNHLLPLMVSDPREHLFLGREHGLGFVPMITVQREQIRRETKLMAAIVPHATSYQISFAGDTRLTLFDKS